MRILRALAGAWILTSAYAIALAGESPEQVDLGPDGRPAVAERLDVTAITVLVSASGDGRPLRDLVAGDLEVLEDGSPVTVLELAAVQAPPAVDVAGETGGEAVGVAPPERPAGKDLPVAVYVDRSLGGFADLRFALRAVAGEVERLTALGPVELVEADRQTGAHPDWADSRRTRALADKPRSS